VSFAAGQRELDTTFRTAGFVHTIFGRRHGILGALHARLGQEEFSGFSVWGWLWQPYSQPRDDTRFPRIYPVASWLFGFVHSFSHLAEDGKNPTTKSGKEGGNTKEKCAGNRFYFAVFQHHRGEEGFGSSPVHVWLNKQLAPSCALVYRRQGKEDVRFTQRGRQKRRWYFHTLFLTRFCVGTCWNGEEGKVTLLWGEKKGVGDWGWLNGTMCVGQHNELKWDLVAHCTPTTS
jgi:hypothetical protein